MGEERPLSEEIKERFPTIIGNVIKLAVAFIIINNVIPVIIPTKTQIFNLFNMNVTVGLVLNLLSFLVIIYYAYYILRDVKVLMDKSVSLLVRKFGIAEREVSLRRAGLDVIWIIALILIHAAVIPLVNTLITSPPWFSSALTLIFTGIALIFLYDCAKTLYTLVKIKISSLAEILAKIVERSEKKIEESKMQKST